MKVAVSASLNRVRLQRVAVRTEERGSGSGSGGGSGSGSGSSGDGSVGGVRRRSCSRSDRMMVVVMMSGARLGVWAAVTPPNGPTLLV